MGISAAVNPLILDALHCENKGRPPVWLMRQAGRFLPEYRALRSNHSLMEMFHQPELISQATLLPVELLGVDAAILFSDILVILEMFGIQYDFREGEGPVIHTPLQADLMHLTMRPAEEVLGYVERAIQLLKPQLKVPLLGFCGAPFTVASYLIEGGSSRDFKKTKQWLFNDPHSFHLLLSKLADAAIDYLKLQIRSGAAAVQIFDSWANLLSYRQFKECSLHYFKQILQGIQHTGVPVILFCRGSSLWAKELAALSPSAISVDWNSDMRQLREHLGGSIALQGNLDPAIFYGSEAYVRTEVQRLLDSMRGDSGFIFNLGHGMLPDAPVERVQLLIDLVKSDGKCHIL